MRLIIPLLWIMGVGITLPICLSGQEADTLGAAIRVLTHYTGDSVVIRWVPPSAGAWRALNQTGYNVERFTVSTRSGSPGGAVKLNTEVLKAKPAEQWRHEGKYGTLARQALAHKAFKIEGAFSSNEILLTGKQQEETGFTFAMLAADLEVATANNLALRFVDRTVQPNTEYMYKISPATKPAVPVKPGFAFQKTIRTPAPTPKGIKIIEADSAIYIQWDKTANDRHFSAYFIERSLLKPKRFIKRNPLPFISSSQTGYYVYRDTIGKNYVKYLYRVRGLTPFGTLSEPSDSVLAMGRDKTPPPLPHITSGKDIGRKRIKLEWELSSAYATDLAGFRVLHAPRPDTAFTDLTPKPLSPTVRAFTDYGPEPFRGNYYKVVAFDTAGNRSESMPMFVPLIDSFAPARPSGFEGYIDSLGIVHLKWDKNKDPDLKGYRVFHSNHPDREFTQITVSPAMVTTFLDTIQVRSLYKYIYYKIAAVDYHENQSMWSDVLRLKRPDVVAPAKPVMAHADQSHGVVHLRWAPSFSKDVVKHVLYRKTEGDNAWERLREFSGGKAMVNRYNDSTVVLGRTYSYAVEAVDDGGLKSGLSGAIHVTVHRDRKKITPTEVGVAFDARAKAMILQWKYPYNEKDLHQFAIYRSINDGPPLLLEILPQQAREFQDKSLNQEGSYSYRVKVLHRDGGDTPLSSPAVINYPPGKGLNDKKIR